MNEIKGLNVKTVGEIIAAGTLADAAVVRAKMNTALVQMKRR